MRPTFACGVSSPFLTLPPILSVGGQEVGGPWVVVPGVSVGERKKISIKNAPKTLKQAAIGASLTHPLPGAQISAAATTPHARILDRVSWPAL